jgi:hypothetical protein
VPAGRGQPGWAFSVAFLVAERTSLLPFSIIDNNSEYAREGSDEDERPPSFGNPPSFAL